METGIDKVFKKQKRTRSVKMEADEKLDVARVF
jgi:hypothetical protein